MQFTQKEIDSLKSLSKTSDGQALIAYFERVCDDLRKIPEEGTFDKDQLWEIVTSRSAARNEIIKVLDRLKFHQSENVEKKPETKKENRQYN